MDGDALALEMGVRKMMSLVAVQGDGDAMRHTSSVSGEEITSTWAGGGV